MRRVALGLVGSGVVLFAGSALGAMGAWATVASVLLLAGGAVVLAIAMEEADLTTPRLTAVASSTLAKAPDPAA